MPLNILQIKFFYVAKNKKKDKKKLKEKRNENWNLKRPVTLCIFTKQFFSLNENMRSSRFGTKEYQNILLLC